MISKKIRKFLRANFIYLRSFFFKIPLPIFLFEFLEKINSIYLGKGWGSSTIREEVKTCIKLLKKEPYIFIDIGANRGSYTQEILLNFPKIECHIFEPSGQNYNFLKNLFKNNKNVKINHLALGEENCSGTLFSNKFGSGLASLTKRRLDHFGIEMKLKEEINLLRFDSYWCDDQRIIDYVKIDVEGHELDVLNGFGDLVLNTKLIQFEFGGCNIDTRTYFQDFWYFFLEKGFKIYRIAPKGKILITKYEEQHEYFLTTNYVAINDRFN